MVAWALVAALSAQSPDPSDVDPARGPPDAALVPGASTLRVVVLPIESEELSDEDTGLLRRLIGIEVQKAGLTLVDSAAADISVTVTHTVFADADVVTVEAVDVAQRARFSNAVSTRERGELPEKLGPVVAEVLKRAVAALPPLLRPDLKAQFADAHLGICHGAGGWFFCDDVHRAVTENEFVRRYRAETQRHDLDTAEVDRDPSYEPWIFIIGGGATAVATVGATVAIGSTTEGQAFARQSDDTWVVLPVLGLSASLSLLVYGALELDDAGSIHDGTELDHVLDEPTAQTAVRAYDDALRRRLIHDAR